VYVAVEAAGKTTAELRPITNGERTSDEVEVTKGLAAGDAVIIEGLARLKPGAPVRIEATSAGEGTTAERMP
jgi:multidrug efflux pump subunit AcrA (membrane-fusion protein)